MPYIKPVQREALDAKIEALAEAIRTLDPEATMERAGILNYAITRLAVKTLPERRYSWIALFTGVFHNVAAEFYRRVAHGYEDQKCHENGDVYDSFGDPRPPSLGGKP